MGASERDGGLWRPADLEEGWKFEKQWCAHCVNRGGAGDWEDEFGNEVEGSCPIADAMFWAPGYQEPDLVVRHGQPWCKAFRQDPEVPARCLFTKEMF